MQVSHPDPWQWRERLVHEIVLRPEVLEVPVREAHGRVLASALFSPEQVPSVPVAAMDGFAVRRAELQAHRSTVLPVGADLPARHGEVPALAPGTAARIMTGAPVPRGADLVVEVEATDADPHGPVPPRVRISLAELPATGRHVREVGEEIGAGELLADAGTRIRAGLIGLVRTLGVRTLPVLAPSRVSVVVTGDELARDGDPATPGSVRESNGTMLAAALAADGCVPRVLVSGDDPAALSRTLEDAAEGADLVLTTGGIGHGAYDVVKALLDTDDGSRFVHLALRPGGPQGAGLLQGGVPVLHLPGTPVGALVGYHLFVRPLLPGVACGVRRVALVDPEGRVATSRRREGLVVSAGALVPGADGTEAVALLPGRRLAPYGRADVMVLGGSGADTGDASTVEVISL